MNDVADSDGVAPPLEVPALVDVPVAALDDEPVAAGAEVLLLLELLELPQAASARLIPTTSTAATALPFRKCMDSLLLLASAGFGTAGHASSHGRRPVN